MGAYVAQVDRALGSGQALYPASMGPVGVATDMPAAPPPPPGRSGTAGGVDQAGGRYQSQWQAAQGLDGQASSAASAGQAEAQAGRAGATGVRGSAQAQAAAIAPATGSPAGVKLLVSAMDDKLAAMQRQLTTTQEQNRLLALRMRQAAMAYRMAVMGSRGGMAPMMGAGLNAGMGMASPALSGLGSGAGSLGQLGSGLGSPVSSAISPFAQSGSWASPSSTGLDRMVGSEGRGSEAALKAVQFARTKLGRPYIWGATGPRAYDCSGLVQAAYRAAGIGLPRTTYQMIHVGQPVSRSDIRPGDLILSNFSRPGRPEHVQMAISSSMVIEAPRTGGHVHISSIPSGPIAVRRIAR